MLILFALLMSVAVIAGKDLGEELSDLADAFTRLTRALPPAIPSRGFGGSISYGPDKKVSLWVGAIEQRSVDAIAIIKKPSGKSPIEIASIDLQKRGVKYVVPIADPGCSSKNISEVYSLVLEAIREAGDIKGPTRKYLHNAVFDLPPEQRSLYIDFSSGGLKDITSVAIPLLAIGPDCSEDMITEALSAAAKAINAFMKKSSKITEIVIFIDTPAATQREILAYVELGLILAKQTGRASKFQLVAIED